ncbi:MAG: outer membrane protein assembly factor BamE (lipoprotein component of BamABCDE complex) [Candidatus Paceibacteria bacterium]|jgi:outer membrane protein assembly factor BamE (lipoprotein component of BamABCDE complex)
MNNRLFLLAAAILCVTSSSCFVSRERINPPINQSAYGRLEPGKSNADDVLRELGAPADVVQLGKRSAWRYDHTQKKAAAFWPIVVVLSNTETQQDRIWAFFDESGRLTHIGGTFAADSAEYRMPWEDR